MADYPQCMTDDQFALLLEERAFGFGTARHVFSVPTDPDVVVKKTVRPHPGSNMTEWLIWQAAAAAQKKLDGVLGRCISISESGTYLMMERLDDLNPSDYADIPDVPAWFNDPKPDAFGKRNGVIKIRDYGLVHLDKLISEATTHPPAFAVNARTKRDFGI